MSERERLTLAAFARTPGKVLGVVALTGDVSDWVRVNKPDLIESLRTWGYTHVQIERDTDAVLFHGALS